MKRFLFVVAASLVAVSSIGELFTVGGGGQAFFTAGLRLTIGYGSW